MLYKSLLSLLFLFALPFLSLAQDRADPVKKANSANETKADGKKVDEDIARFLVKSADARMMDSKEGKLATQRGTTAAIKDYGALMIKDQAMLLGLIQQLAAKRAISLPADISNDKNEGHEDLQKKSGEAFDKKFIKMMVLDHKRDIKIFKKAAAFEDKEISDFAKKYLPLIESHLEKIKAIKG